MSTRNTVITVVVIFALALGGLLAYNELSAQQQSGDENRCTSAPQKVVDTVTEGLVNGATYDRESAVLVATRSGARDSTGWPKALFAMRVQAPGKPQAVAVWGTGDPRGLVLPVTSVNDTAREASRWGIRVSGVDPQAVEQRRFAAGLDETTLAESCSAAR